jgi:hypothetical protein
MQIDPNVMPASRDAKLIFVLSILAYTMIPAQQMAFYGYQDSLKQNREQ